MQNHNFEILSILVRNPARQKCKNEGSERGDATKSGNLYTSKPERVLSGWFLCKTSYNQSGLAAYQLRTGLWCLSRDIGETHSQLLLAYNLADSLWGWRVGVDPGHSSHPNNSRLSTSRAALPLGKVSPQSVLTETTTTIENLLFCKKVHLAEGFRAFFLVLE